MTDEEFLNDIKIQRELHSVIKHLVMVAVRVIQTEKDVAEIKKHLGIEAKKTDEKE